MHHPPREAWWKQGLETEAPAARAALAAGDAVHSAAGAWVVGAAQLRAELDAACATLLGMQAERLLDDDKRAAKSKVDNVAKQVSQVNPGALVAAAVTMTVTVFPMPCYSRACLPSSRPTLRAADCDPVRFRLCLPLPTTNTSRHPLAYAVHTCTHYRGTDIHVDACVSVCVCVCLRVCAAAWWKQGIDDSKGALDLLDQLRDKHAGSPAWGAVDAELRAELAAAVGELQNKQAARALEDDQRAVRSVLDTVTRQISQVRTPARPAMLHACAAGAFVRAGLPGVCMCECRVAPRACPVEHATLSTTLLPRHPSPALHPSLPSWCTLSCAPLVY